MYKVSVIIPIYNVENFIAKCAASLFEQTLTDIEYIFVDDATPDHSMEVLRQVLNNYPNRQTQVKIIAHDKNKGLPAARNTGLEIASGEYIFHCDSDDFVELDMLEQLYNNAVETQADIVWCDWFLTFEENERYMKQPFFSTSLEALKAMLGGGMKYNVWNKLVKRSLYKENGIVFPSGYGMGEDMTMMMLFAYAKKVKYVPKAFYHYIKFNTTAFTHDISEKHLESLQYNVQRLSKFIKENFGHELDKELAFLKLEAKFPFLVVGSSHKLYYLWQEWFPEANSYIWQNRNISFRSKFIQWCASKKIFIIVRLHYYCVIKLIYGIIYR